ncbi:Gfo/Idh/MocA family protein [Rufibacter glacialis]|uniref:Gfo/Idh/MocA family oxidoreductase n=1 Tax=Rufibacter glacialis TaxID=1259555 RepID=A0A5M8QHP1_9BACT|nr:Gfo/Idh/MocA family oxidoreductase [Rufibacter glacialis]KAA6435549.1 Gfo/Idh/MocA family oxidoreductase [Rufibacter glacialis]GGK64488.1 oxidoreductase [Rufibacter glacialis]
MSEDTLLEPSTTQIEAPTDTLKLGFLGIGWIGRNRMEAIAKAGAAEVTAVVDPVPQNVEEVLRTAPDARVNQSLEELVAEDIDGVVIATPSAFHAEQSIKALERGKAVFCQKPLGRFAEETRRVVAAARKADTLLGVDLSYRSTVAMRKVYDLVKSGELGEIYGVELVFHNAYGPDKAWFYDPKLSGGGCVIDLGVHLVDLALWTLDFPEVETVTSSLFSKGKRLASAADTVEDYATASIQLATGPHVQLSCSWNLPAGQEAIISATFYGTNGGAAFKNVNGSFYDFVAERFWGTKTETLVTPPDEWGGRAGVEWAQRVAKGEKFNEEAEQFVKVAEVLDRIYGR